MHALLSLAMAAALVQQTQSFTISLTASVAQVTPLFGPVGEAQWAPGWAPTFLHPAEGAQRNGVVFTTTTPKGYEQVWVLTEYDVAAGRVAYVILTPGYDVKEIQIRVVADGPSRSKATVTYRDSALVERANDDVRRLDAQWAAEQSRHWEAAINAALVRKGAGK